MSGYKTINPDELEAAAQKGGAIIDVRTHAEHTEKCLGLPHIHIPMDELKAESLKSEHNLGLETPLYILCLGGKRAAVVASHLVAEGFKNISVVTGGLMACEKCGHSIQKNN